MAKVTQIIESAEGGTATVTYEWDGKSPTYMITASGMGTELRREMDTGHAGQVDDASAWRAMLLQLIVNNLVTSISEIGPQVLDEVLKRVDYALGQAPASSAPRPLPRRRRRSVARR